MGECASLRGGANRSEGRVDRRVYHRSPAQVGQAGEV